MSNITHYKRDINKKILESTKIINLKITFIISVFREHMQSQHISNYLELN